MTGLLVALVYCAAAISLGLMALRLMRMHALTGMPLGACALILGQALFSATWLLLGLAGWLKPWVIWTVIAATTAAAAPVTVYWIRACRTPALATFNWWKNETLAWRFLGFGVLVFAAALAVAAWIKPPFGDAEAFYMTYARVIAATGHIEPMPGLYETFSSIGMVGEPQFAALIAISGVPAAKLFVWFLAAATAAMLLAIGRMAGLEQRDSLILLVLLATTTAYTHHIWDGKVDLFAAALGLLAIYGVLASRGMTSMAALAMAGVAAGFAVVAKFSYAISLAPAVLVLLLWPRMRNTVEPRPVTRIFIVGTCAALATIPHLIKNAIMFDAPLAPFIGGAADQNWLQQVWFAPDVIRRIIATYPFALAFGRYPMQGGNLSFLLIAFLPLLWWLARPQKLRESLLFQLCVAGFIGTLVWIALRPSIIAPRYLLAVLLLFYPLLARAAGLASNPGGNNRLLAAAIPAICAAALAIFSYPLLPITAQSARQFAGHSPAPCALASEHCEPLLELNRQAASGTRVYALSYYLYWMRDDLLQCRDRGTESKMIQLLGGPGLTWRWLLDHGFEWVVVDLRSHAKDHAALLSSTRPDFLNVKIHYQDDNLLLLHMQNHRTPVAAACKLNEAGSWTPFPKP